MRGDGQSSRVLIELRIDGKRQMQVGRGQSATCLLRPLDHHHCASIKRFLKTRITPSPWMGQPIKIIMMEFKPREIIRFDQRKSGTGNAPPVAERTQQLAHQCGLARAEIANEVKTKAWHEAACDDLGERARRIQAIQHALGGGQPWRRRDHVAGMGEAHSQATARDSTRAS